MPVLPSGAKDALRSGNRVVVWGIAAIVAILLIAAILLFTALPDANAFNARVERIFVENDALTTSDQLKLLEILAQSGTSFSEVLNSYRIIIFVLLVFATALLIAALVFLVMIVELNRRMETIQKQGMQVSSLIISRAENAVVLNDMEFKLTEAAIETLSVLAEARLDDDVLTGSDAAASSVTDAPTTSAPERVFTWTTSSGKRASSSLSQRRHSLRTTGGQRSAPHEANSARA